MRYIITDHSCSYKLTEAQGESQAQRCVDELRKQGLAPIVWQEEEYKQWLRDQETTLLRKVRRMENGGWIR